MKARTTVKQSNSDNASENEHKEKEHHLLHFKQSITKHSNLMKYVGISCNYVEIFGFSSYLLLEFILRNLSHIITQLISYYVILTIAIITFSSVSTHE